MKRRTIAPGLALLLAATTAISLGSSGPAAAADCTVDAVLVNSCGPWLGASADDYIGKKTGDVKPEILAHEERIGRKLSLVHTYHPVGNDRLTNDDRYFALRDDTYLIANWKPAKKWADVKKGKRDAGIDRMAASIKSLGNKKIFLTLHHEAENDTKYSSADGCAKKIYRGKAGTTKEFVEMWRYVHERFEDRGVTNVVWFADYMNYFVWDCLVDNLWPGNQYVDWVYFNAYGSNVSVNTRTFAWNVQRFHDVMAKYQGGSRDYASKPLGIIEWGMQDTVGADKQADYLRQAKVALEENRFLRLKAWVVFDNYGPQGPRADYRVGYVGKKPNKTEAAAYRSFARSEVFVNAP